MSDHQVARKPVIDNGDLSPIDYRQFEIIGWAMLHAPTREAYRRSTGEDVGPALDRYQVWLAENIVGGYQ